jgi:hypothetical protein
VLLGRLFYPSLMFVVSYGACPRGVGLKSAQLWYVEVEIKTGQKAGGSVLGGLFKPEFVIFCFINVNI